MLHTWPNAERLRELRRRALVTQVEVERLTGINARTLSRLERGHCQPRITTLRRLLGWYNLRIQMQERDWAVMDTAEGAAPVAQASQPQPTREPAQSPEHPHFYRRDVHPFVRKAR